MGGSSGSNKTLGHRFSISISMSHLKNFRRWNVWRDLVLWCVRVGTLSLHFCSLRSHQSLRNYARLHICIASRFEFQRNKLFRIIPNFFLFIRLTDNERRENKKILRTIQSTIILWWVSDVYLTAHLKLCISKFIRGVEIKKKKSFLLHVFTSPTAVSFTALFLHFLMKPSVQEYQNKPDMSNNIERKLLLIST